MFVVAIKVVHKRHAVARNESPRNEFVIMRAVSESNDGKGHPHILRALMWTELETHFCAVFELASKGDMFRLLEAQGPFSESRALKYFSQLVAAVAFLHSHGIVHLDISLENVLVDTQDVVKLSDFGVYALFCSVCPHDFCVLSGMARTIVTISGSECELLSGTPGKRFYRAPEIVAGKRFDGRSVDAFALGVVLFSMLTGSLPFSDATLSGMSLCKSLLHSIDVLATYCLLLLVYFLSFIDLRYCCIASGHLRTFLKQNCFPPVSDSAQVAIVVFCIPSLVLVSSVCKLSFTVFLL